MTNEREKIDELRNVLGNILYVLTGTVTPEAIIQLRAYVARKVKKFNED